MLAKYPLFEGELPPTIVGSLWHSYFSRRRNPFTLCYMYGDGRACEYLKQFGNSRERQARAYYLWAQTVPTQFWRYFDLLSLTKFDEVVADMIPPLPVANLIRIMDFYPYFKGADVADLFAGVCGWLMAFAFLPSHYLPRRWTAVDADSRRLQICKLAGEELGVDVVTVRRDLSRPYFVKADVVVGSPPCHEFSSAKVSAPRRVDDGLGLVRSFLESAKAMRPALSVMEESVTVKDTEKRVGDLVAAYGYKYMVVPLRDFGAIQHARTRLIAWRKDSGE